jgi:hypothetical protein
MNDSTDPRILGLLAILVGILIVIYPILVGYVVGISLVAYGLLKILT